MSTRKTYTAELTDDELKGLTLVLHSIDAKHLVFKPVTAAPSPIAAVAGLQGEGNDVSDTRDKPAADTLSRVRDFTQRLETGGDLLATGLQVTTWEQCGCQRVSRSGGVQCRECHGTGVLRVRMERGGN